MSPGVSKLGRVSLPYNLNWVLTVVDGCAWLLCALLLNLSMLRDHSLSPFRRVAWDVFLSYRQRSERELAERLNDKLRAERIEPWLDQKKIAAGDSPPARYERLPPLLASSLLTPVLSSSLPRLLSCRRRVAQGLRGRHLQLSHLRAAHLASRPRANARARREVAVR